MRRSVRSTGRIEIQCSKRRSPYEKNFIAPPSRACETIFMMYKKLKDNKSGQPSPIRLGELMISHRFGALLTGPVKEIAAQIMGGL